MSKSSHFDLAADPLWHDDKEAAVAVELSKDRTLAEITQARGVPPSTIKTQLDERPPPASRRVFKGFASVGQAAQSLARST